MPWASIPPSLLVADAIGTVLAGLGLAGLLTDLSGILPFMAERDLAGMIAGVGLALMTFSMLKIAQILRARRQPSPQHDPK